MKGLRTAAAIVAGVAATGLTVSAAEAARVRVTVVNTQDTGGLSLTPLYFGFHDGSVDLFDEGGVASAGLEEIAETGMFGPLRDERVAIQGDSVGGAAFGTGGAVGGPIEPGESASFVVDLDAIANRFAFFAAMILPSNDSFVALDDSMTINLFNDDGSFVNQTFFITGEHAYDAGTEENDPANGGAFLEGVDIALGGPGEGTIEQGVSLGDFTGLSVAGGLGLNPELIDNFVIPSEFQFASITFTEVPVPPAFFAMGLGLAGLAAARRKRV